jgi:hypothetical protein
MWTDYTIQSSKQSTKQSIQSSLAEHSSLDFVLIYVADSCLGNLAGQHPCQLRLKKVLKIAAVYTCVDGPDFCTAICLSAVHSGPACTSGVYQVLPLRVCRKWFTISLLD